MSERVSVNFFTRAVKGLSNGGPSVLGYDQDPSNPSQLLVNEAEAASVRRVFEIYLEEGSLAKTTEQLISEKIKPKYRNNRIEKHINAGTWTSDAVLRVLRNPSYVGNRVVNAKHKNDDPTTLKPYEQYKIVKASWPAIVNPKVFYATQSLLDRNLSLQRSRLSQSEKRVFSLTGILYCEDCGRPLVGSSGHGVNNVHRYYRHSRVPGQVINCSVKSIRSDDLEQAVSNHLDQVLFRDGYFDEIEQRLVIARRQSGGDTKASVKEIESKSAKIEKQIRTTIKLISEMSEDGMDLLLKDTLRDLKNKKNEYESRRAALLDMQDGMESPSEFRNGLEDSVGEFQDALKKSSASLQKRILQKIFTAVSIKGGVLRLAYAQNPARNLSVENKNESVAPGNSPGAIPFLITGKRILVMANATIPTEPALTADPHLMIKSGYIVLNGVPGRSRSGGCDRVEQD